MEADFVIIGSGSAGAAMAYRLSEDGKHSVLVLEYGGTDIGPFIQMPAALASMFSKYVREAYMARFNRFWSSHMPGLKPTAGYPQDAQRFLRDIAEIRDRLGIELTALVRMR